MTIQEFNAKKSKAEEQRATATRLMAEAEARGDLRKAVRCRMTILDANYKLIGLARSIRKAKHERTHRLLR